MSRLLTCLVLFTTMPLWAQWSKLPDWSQVVLEKTDLNAPPAEAELWRLLDETTITPMADGKFEQRRRIVQYVISPKGGYTASAFYIDGDENATKIKRLKGWHLGSNGKLDKITKSQAVTIGGSTRNRLTTDAKTLAYFSRVGVGSIVVFESREIFEAYFPVNTLTLITSFPIKQRIIVLNQGTNGETGEIIPIGLDTWGLTFKHNGGHFEIENIPPFKDEILSPSFPDPYPMILLSMKDSARLASWDNLAKWYSGIFNEKALTNDSTGQGTGLSSKEALVKMVSVFSEKMTYRQRYLSPGRGWEPAAGAKVERRGYGDCKDFVSCLADRANTQGRLVYPVFANIVDGFHTDESHKPGPFFNHLIAAILLEKTLGLPAEVEIDGQRLLLFDPTSRHTPIGSLPTHYRGRTVMVAKSSGAHWLKIPDAALETQSLKIDLSGLLNENFTLTGALTITETGDAYHLRSTLRDGNDRDLEWRFRNVVDLPGQVSLQPISKEMDDQQRLTIVYQLTWPSFLQRDAGSLRLPSAIIDWTKRNLVVHGKERVYPIAQEERPLTTWNLAISSKTSLKPVIEKAAWQGIHHDFSWEAQGGKKLQVRFSQTNRPMYYSKSQIEEGLAYWETYRTNFNSFWMDGTLFDIAP